MYYRKYFAGTVENAGLTKSIVDISDSRYSRSDYYIKSGTICNAMRETLGEAGISCEYSEQNSTLNIDGLTVQFLCYGNVNYVYYNANGAQLGNQSVSPFNGNNYKFYITLKGDIESILIIYIGIYANPAIEGYGIAIGKGRDLKDGEQIYTAGSLVDAVNNSRFFILKNDKILEDFKGVVNFGFQMTNDLNLNGSGTEYTLVECIAQPGRFKLDNCYFGSPMLSNGYFYNIGGDIYYKLSNNIVAKCTSGGAA